MPSDPPSPRAVLPAGVVLGLGASRGCPAGELATLVDATLAEADAGRGDVVAVATATVKADEPAIVALAAVLGVPLRLLDAAALAGVDVPTPSAVGAAHVGTPSVAEASALLIAGQIAAAADRGNRAGAPMHQGPTPEGSDVPDPDGADAAFADRPAGIASADPIGTRGPAARLLVEKRRSPHATCAVATATPIEVLLP